MVKFADDTYLVIPASNCGSCVEEVQYVRDWASSNNLRLNHVKSMEIVFVSPRCRRAVVIPSPADPTTLTVEEIKALDQQEIFGGPARKPSTCIVCAVVCTAHSSTSWPADRCSTYCFSGHSPQSSLNCHMRHLHGGDSLRLLIAIV